MHRLDKYKRVRHITSSLQGELLDEGGVILHAEYDAGYWRSRL